MSLETKLVTLLLADAVINRKVNDRITPIVIEQATAVIQDGSKLAAITYQQISAQKINHLRGYSGLENPHMTINSWCLNYKIAKELAKNVHDAMDGATTFRSLLANELDVFDPETGLFAASQDFSCWNQE